MKTVIGIATLVVVTITLLSGCSGGEEGAIRGIIDDVREAALNGAQFHAPNTLDAYFATVAEGAQAAGLTQTQQAYQDFVSQLSASDAVQFHSFDIQAVEVHQEAGLAKVTYRLHFSVLRSGQVVFGAVVTQDLALLKTSRGWRISGGDAPQLENVQGAWPPR